ncbi:MAG: sigma-70 family RNA polymerase sigma factor, partial [Bryobacteraceae bacterium]
MSAQWDEQELLRRVHHRDQDALLLLYRQHSGRVFALAYRILNNRHEAEEIVQEVFLRLWEKASQYDPAKGALLAWLLTVTRNLALDFKRREIRRSRFFVSFSTGDENGEGMEGIAFNPGDRELTRQALLSLPPEQREILELSYFEGFTQSEVAEELNIPL